jgi:hypothetical protein
MDICASGKHELPPAHWVWEDGRFYVTHDYFDVDVYCNKHCYLKTLKEEGEEMINKINRSYPEGEICNNCKCSLTYTSYHGNIEKWFDKDPCYIPILEDYKLWFCSFMCREKYVKVTENLTTVDKLMKYIYRVTKNKKSDLQKMT